jgi:DNA polymerase-3 subunit gamma/tau
VGEDVDVLEIDGASNRGIDEIRQLRSNVGIRPSRARFKIYIIDEVHMLTSQAFNALLKTLEEPPEHVKFIFCTTDPEKIPITVLSRCQRFDFAPVQTPAIVERLRQIVAAEGRGAEDAALELLARRAAGSMRDSQSLLEQLLAYCGQTITVEDVNQLLGIASSKRMADLVERLMARDAAGSLAALDQAVAEGVDLGQLAEQLLGHLRDMLACAVGCREDQLLHAVSGDFPALQAASREWGFEAILAAAQILDEALLRMRQSMQTRTLLEVALVRICRLEDLQNLASAIAGLRSGTPSASHPPPTAAPQQVRTPKPSAEGHEAGRPSPPSRPESAQRNGGPALPPAVSKSSPPRVLMALDSHSAEMVWKQALSLLGDMTAECAAMATRIAIPAPNRLVVFFPAGYNYQKETCERPERRQRLEEALAEVTGGSIRLEFELLPGEAPVAAEAPAVSRRQLIQQTIRHPLVNEALEAFDGEIVRVDQGSALQGARESDEPGG